MVGRKGSDYTNIRNRALRLLVDAGLNNGHPTSLALAINPITIWNIDETFEVYKWGRLRNMYCIVTPSMISGRAKDKTWLAITPPKEQIENLYAQIYKFNVEKGLQTKEQITKKEFRRMLEDTLVTRSQLGCMFHYMELY